MIREGHTGDLGRSFSFLFLQLGVGEFFLFNFTCKVFVFAFIYVLYTTHTNICDFCREFFWKET